MFRMLMTSGLLAVLCLSSIQADEKVADIDEAATHSQARKIEIQQGPQDKMQVNAFCLNTQDSGRNPGGCWQWSG